MAALVELFPTLKLFRGASAESVVAIFKYSGDTPIAHWCSCEINVRAALQKKCPNMEINGGSPISLFYSIELILLLELRKLLKYDAMSHYSMNKVDYLDGSRGKTLCDVLITNAPMSLPVVR